VLAAVEVEQCRLALVTLAAEGLRGRLGHHLKTAKALGLDVRRHEGFICLKKTAARDPRLAKR
jgi:hypothetical protein